MMEEGKLPQTYWPQTNVPYGEDTAFAAAKVYAGAITGWQEIFEQKNALLRRAAELLQIVDDPSRESTHIGEVREWISKRDQWLKDTGLEK